MRRTIHFYIITCMTLLLLKCARSDHDDFLQTYPIEQNVNNTDISKICEQIHFDNEIEAMNAKINAFHLTKITDVTKNENLNDKSSGSHCVENIRTPAHSISMRRSTESHRRTRELRDSNRHQLFEKRTHKQRCLDKENQRRDIRKTHSRTNIQRDALSENVSMNRIQYDRRRFVAARISNAQTHLPRVSSTLRARNVQEEARGITNRLNTRDRNIDRNDIKSFHPNIRSIERINKRNEDSKSDERKTMDRSTQQENKRDKELSVGRRLQVREEARTHGMIESEERLTIRRLERKQSGRRDIDHNGQVFERRRIVPFSHEESKSFNTDVDRGRTLILTGRRNSSRRNTDKRIDIHRHDRSSERQSREGNYARNARRQTATERLERRLMDERQEIRRMDNERRHENLISRNIQTDNKLQNERSNARDVQADRGHTRRFGTVKKQAAKQSIRFHEERSNSVYKVDRFITTNNPVSERRSSERRERRERRNAINENEKRPISNGDKETNHVNVDQVRFRESEHRRRENEHRQRENEHRRRETEHRQGENEHRRIETKHRQEQNEHRRIETKHRQGENEHRRIETKHRQGENEHRRIETKHRQGENEHRLIETEHRQRENEHRRRENEYRQGENEHRRRVTEHRQGENEHRRIETEHRPRENEHRRRENEHRRIETKHRQGENEHRRRENEHRHGENEHRLRGNDIGIKYRARLDTERREHYHDNRNRDDETFKRRLQRRIDKPEKNNKVMSETSREHFRRDGYQQKTERMVTIDKQRFVRDTMEFRTRLQKNEDQNRGIGISTVWTGYHNIVDQNGITRAIVVGFIGIIGRGIWQKQA